MRLFPSWLMRRLVFFLGAMLALGSQGISADPLFDCYPVRPGETAAELSLRLTGNAANVHAPWFQIVDPSRSTSIAKTQHRRMFAGWQGCIAVQYRQAYAATNFSVGWWWMPLLLVLPAIWLVGTALAQREANRPILRRFGDEFIREFERPLIQQPFLPPPVRSQIHLLPHRNRLEILIAPQKGRRYPNLSDHRKNLEYDVERVARLLGDPRFVARQFSARGPWVVIPFQFQSVANKEGVL
jgi:hypothetical protein